jgi:LCP family protein required for cell wall assembly
VNVPWAVKNINNTYAALGDGVSTGSIEGVMDGLKAILGFPLDNYFLININAFEEMVAAIGGVYYDVPRDMFYDDPGQNLHIAISAGPQLLDGEDALHVVRFRIGNGGTGYANGDLGRIDTQQDFLLSVAKQMLSVGNIPNLPTLIQIAVDNVKTDLTENNLAFYAQEFLKLDGENIRFHTLQADGIHIGRLDYVSIHVDEWLEMVNDYLNPFSQQVTRDNVDILTTTDGVNFTSTTGSVPTVGSFY